MPKTISDTLTITWLQLLRFKAGWVWTPILLLFPFGMLFFARYLVPEGVPIGPRLIAGSVVLSLGMTTVNIMANNLTWARFTFRQALIQACPVHPLSYAAGNLLYFMTYASIQACAILLFAPLFGIDIHLSVWFIPVAAFTSISLAGLALVVAFWSPNVQVGQMMATTVGVLVTIVSPIYFPASRLPDWLAAITLISPYTHAANALDRILSGDGGFYGEMAILAAITAVGMVIGVAGMRWREV